MSTKIEPISALKRAGELVAKLREDRRPIYITQNGKAAAVLQDVQSYEDQQEALALLKLCVDGEASIDRGESHSVRDVRKRSKTRAKGR